MAEWKTQLSYNYNPSYHHAYAYGIMYQAGPETNLGPLPGWAEHGVAELGNYNAAVPQAYYTTAAPARPREDSPGPRSPEHSVLNHHGHYQNPGLVYLSGSQNGRLCLPGQQATNYDPLVDDDGGGCTRSGTPTSDSDPHTSPDSWSSASSKEESLPQADPAVWVKKEFEEVPEAGSPDTSHELSAILEDPHTFKAEENEDPSAAYATAAESTPAPKTPRAAAGRGKLRTTFSEDQMNALVQRFSVQRYLTPAEMKSLAGQSGLSYKQVKTWFQNRRMKLRRHQKDTSWVSEHYKTKKAGTGAANSIPVAYSNMVPRLQQWEDGRSQLQEEYSQHMMEAGGVYKNTAPPQSLAYYLAAMGVASPAGYPGAWSAGGPRAAPLPTRQQQQAPGWPMAPSANEQQQYPYDYTHPYTTGPLAPADSTTNVDETLHMALGQDADPRLENL